MHVSVCSVCDGIICKQGANICCLQIIKAGSLGVVLTRAPDPTIASTHWPCVCVCAPNQLAAKESRGNPLRACLHDWRGRETGTLFAGPFAIRPVTACSRGSFHCLCRRVVDFLPLSPSPTPANCWSLGPDAPLEQVARESLTVDGKGRDFWLAAAFPPKPCVPVIEPFGCKPSNEVHLCLFAFLIDSSAIARASCLVATFSVYGSACVVLFCFTAANCSRDWSPNTHTPHKLHSTTADHLAWQTKRQPTDTHGGHRL